MATITLRGSTLTIAYVDVDLASGANDGSTPANAFQTLPAATALTANTVYLIRRTNTDVTFVKGITPGDEVYFMGMPISSQYYYDLLPVEATSAWGADVATDVNIKVNLTNLAWQLDGDSCGVFNVDIICDPNQDIIQSVIDIRGSKFIGEDFSVQVDTIPLGSNPPDATYTGINISCLQFYTNAINGVILRNCDLQSLNARTINIFNSTYSNNITFSHVNIYSLITANSSYYGIYAPVNFKNSVFEDCKIYANFSNNTDNLVFIGTDINGADDTIFRRLECYFNDANTGTGDKVGFDVGSGSRNTFQDITVVSNNTHQFTGMKSTGQQKSKFERINISAPNITSINSNTVYGMSLPNSDNSTFEDITIDVNASATTQAEAFSAFSSDNACVTNGTFYSGNTAINTTGMSFYNCRTKGAVKGTNTFIHLIEMGNEGSTETPFYENSNTSGLLYAESVQLSASAISNPTIDTDGFVIVEEVLNANLIFSPQGDSGKIYVNSEFIENLWHHETAYNRMFSTSAQRISGGGISGPGDQPGYSIKCTGLQDADNQVVRAAVIAPKPFNGIPIIFGSTGSKRVTLHFAARFEVPTDEKIWFELEVPDSPSGTGLSQYSSYGLVPEADPSSVWDGDDNLNNYKLSIEFELERDEPVYGRIYYNALTSIGYYYIDAVLVPEDL